MIFGVLKDIKEGEYRVICTPMEVASIVGAGHTVLVEKDCGAKAGFPDEAYAKMGATVVETAKEMWAKSRLSGRLLYSARHVLTTC